MCFANSPSIAVSFLFLGLVGCASDTWPEPRYPDYDVIAFNRTDGNITDFRLSWPLDGKEWVANEGVIFAHQSSGVAFQPDPIPEVAHLQWRTPDGVMHRHDVEIAAKIPNIEHFTGTIYVHFMDLTDQGYRVGAISDAEHYRQSALGHYDPPFLPVGAKSWPSTSEAK